MFELYNHDQYDCALWSLVQLVQKTYTTQLHQPRAQRVCLKKKSNLCSSAFSETESNRRAGVRVGKYCTTQTLWDRNKHT